MELSCVTYMAVHCVVCGHTSLAGVPQISGPVLNWDVIDITVAAEASFTPDFKFDIEHGSYSDYTVEPGA
uniref:Secreted protein n=1 Tax=Angiostrongylus cantonensis TaxID=6313 RepID=A0A0K0CZX7_ANGCA